MSLFSALSEARWPKLPAICIPVVAACCVAAHAQAAPEDLDFIVEHLAEVAMNNDLASLPLWQRDWNDQRRWRGFLTGGYSAVAAQDIDVRGHMVAIAAERWLSSAWALRALAFVDDASLTGTPGVRMLRPIFLRPLPAGLPANAAFGELTGSIRQYATGATVTRRNLSGWLDGSEWMMGLLWHKLSIDRSTTTYRVLEGQAAGTSGTIGYDNDFRYFTLLAGMQWHRRYADWVFAPSWHLTLPLPRGAVAGRLTAPGLDQAGNSAGAGEGHHMGDGYLALGLSVTYLPAHLTVDLGGTLSQFLLEPVVDEGIDRDLVLGIEWSF